MPSPALLPDILSQLKPCTFRGIEFVVSSFNVRLSHDLAEHKRVGIDGGSVEETGRNPLVFTCRAIFRNHVTVNKAAGYFATSAMYPDRFQHFLDAVGDGTNGDLQTPHMGTFKVKVRSVNVPLNPNIRDGVDVDVEFVESGEDALPSLSSVTSAKQAGAVLDAKSKFKPPEDEKDGFSFESIMGAMNKAAGLANRVELLQKRVLGKVKAVIFRVNRTVSAYKSLANSVGDTLDGRTYTSLANSVDDTLDDLTASVEQLGVQLGAPLRKKQQLKRKSDATEAVVKALRAAERVRAAALASALQAAKPPKLKVYVTRGEMTMSAISYALKVPIMYLVVWNPGLASKVSVPSNTMVRYKPNAI